MQMESCTGSKNFRKNISFSIDNAGGAVTLRPR